MPASTATRPAARRALLPLLAGGVLAAFFLAAASPARADPATTMSAHDFQLYKDYQAALQDPRVLKIKPRRRLHAIARNFGVRERELKRAIAVGDKEAPGIAQRCEAQIRAILAAGPLKGRVRDVTVDASQDKVVTYISWTNTDGSKLDQEASLAAIAAVKGAPITWTVGVWAVDGRTGRKVFEAKISAMIAANFRPESVEMFASARYIKMFEDVKNAYQGNPPTDDAPHGPN